MTPEQFSQWEEFSIKMAMGYRNATEARREKILEQVNDFFYWRKFQNDWSQIEDWDGNGDEYYLGESVEEFFMEFQRHSKREECTGRFYRQIVSCIRAGFDVAVKQSGGVIGFTASDVRRMWHGEVPVWVKGHWETSFDLIPDDDYLWL